MSKKEYYYEYVFNDIAQKIESGEYGHKQLLPPERLIADYYQVNRTTVRKALDLLAEKQYIEKRQGAGSQVIYESPEKSDDSNEGGKEKIIGFFLPGGKYKDFRLEQPFYMSLYYYIESKCREHNYRVVCMTVTEMDEFINLTNQYDFSGALFMTKVCSDIVEYARNAGIPSVTVNAKYADIPCITMDNVNGGYLATKYLLDKGHRKIAFITGPEKYFTSEDRILGATKAMNEYDIPFSKKDMVMSDWTYSGGYAAMQELLKQPKETWPSALFVFNEEMSYGAIKALSEQDMNVPEDISIIGFDNTSTSKYGDTVTVIDGNIKLVARTASTVLMNLIDKRGLDYGVVIQLPVRIIEHDSVRSLI